jgi:hypothetical protein
MAGLFPAIQVFICRTLKFLDACMGMTILFAPILR